THAGTGDALRLRAGYCPDARLHRRYLVVVQKEKMVLTAMPAPKSSFLDKVLGRIGRLDKEGLQTVVQRLARERSFLETLFNTIEDGILVVDENARILYLNSAVSALLGLQQNIEGQPASRYLPEIDWQRLISIDVEGGTKVV